jgi:hypothetical protein
MKWLEKTRKLILTLFCALTMISSTLIIMNASPVSAIGPAEQAWGNGMPYDDWKQCKNQDYVFIRTEYRWDSVWDNKYYIISAAANYAECPNQNYCIWINHQDIARQVDNNGKVIYEKLARVAQGSKCFSSEQAARNAAAQMMNEVDTYIKSWGHITVTSTTGGNNPNPGSGGNNPPGSSGSTTPDSVPCKALFDWGYGTGQCPTITQTVTTIFNWAAIGVGVVVVIMVIVGAIQYTTAGGSQERSKKAIEIIRNAILALAFYLLMWAFLNWLVPGGLFT